MKVLAVFCADIHLSHKAPAGRSAEPDWYAAQARYLDQLGRISKEVGAPIFCAGDVFHKYNPPPQLINFAIDCLPKMFAVYGQHDQQHHRSDLSPTAYLTLRKAGVIAHLDKDEGRHYSKECMVAGFSWDDPLEPLESSWDEWSGVKVALVHRYCATETIAHPGAEKTCRPSAMRRALRGYDVAVFGDNHIPFESTASGMLAFNCGCLIPRSRSERSHCPSVGLLMEDGSVVRRYLDCSEDLWTDEAETTSEGPQEGSVVFLQVLQSLGSDSLDFRAALRRAADNEDDGVAKILMDVLEET